VAFLVDQHVALGVREVQELLEDGIDLVNIILVEDEPLLSNVIAVGYDGPPPELLRQLTKLSLFS
jgi:hypothetical protein